MSIGKCNIICKVLRMLHTYDNEADSNIYDAKLLNIRELTTVDAVSPLSVKVSPIKNYNQFDLPSCPNC